MNIVHLSTSDVHGGAARSAYRLHKGLQLLGHKSRMQVLTRGSNDSTVEVLNQGQHILSRLRRGFRRYLISRDFRPYQEGRPAGCEVFSDDRSEYTRLDEEALNSADVINLHWVTGFLDFKAFFFNVPKDKPLVWTLHDMNPFTGGCHYDLGCERYVEQCGSCPQLGSRKNDDLSARIHRRKRQLFSQIEAARLHIVTTSRWLAGEAAKSTILRKFRISVIPNGLDTLDFSPSDRGAIRKLLQIPPESKVVLFVSDGLDNQRKGFTHLKRAVLTCAEKVPNLLLLSIGSNQRQVHTGTPWIHVGSVNNDRFLSMVYSAADLFVICSLQDNLPNTVLEAMACGVPVVGVNAGGIPDMVRNGITGSRRFSRSDRAVA
jgi:glycosyltransferase involved in cell wall biosynthesis